MLVTFDLSLLDGRITESFSTTGGKSGKLERKFERILFWYSTEYCAFLPPLYPSRVYALPFFPLSKSYFTKPRNVLPHDIICSGASI